MDLPNEAPHRVAAKGASKGLSALKGMPTWGYVLVGSGLLLIVLWRRHNAAKATAQTDANQQDSTGTDPTTYDPSTDPYANPYYDPSMAGAYLGGGGTLPNATGVGSSTDASGLGTTTPGVGAGGNTTTTTTTNTDSHDVSDTFTLSPSTEQTAGAAPFQTTTVVQAPATGGGPPSRPAAIHTTVKPSAIPPRSTWGPHTLKAGHKLAGHSYRY